MPDVSRLLNESQTQRIAAALSEAESVSAARLVVVVAGRSGSYERVEDVAGLMIGLLAAGLTWLIVPDAPLGGDSWAGYTAGAKLGMMAVVLLIGFGLGAKAVSAMPAVRRLFTPTRRMRAQVAAGAGRAFHDRRVVGPGDGPRLLIYVSLYERRASVLADEFCLSVMDQADLDTLCRDLVTLLRSSEADEAVSQTVRRAASMLADLDALRDGANALVVR